MKKKKSEERWFVRDDELAIVSEIPGGHRVEIHDRACGAKSKCHRSHTSNKSLAWGCEQLLEVDWKEIE